jgi:competence protein ComEC
MVAAVALALWAGRLASPSRVLALALALVVLLDPWAPLAPGTWLSFGAVLLIFYAAGAWSRPELRILQWGRVQWAMTLGLAPAALFLFGQVSLAGPLANAIAIPLVSIVITPLALVAAAVPFDPLLDLGAWLVEWLLRFLEGCAALPSALWEQHAPPPWSVALAALGIAWLLAPSGIPWRAAGLALVAPAFAVSAPQPRLGEAWISTLDVGQGLAVLVQTAGHALLYDAGPAYGAESDSGGRVVLPLLRARGVRALDALVLTHDDADHVGGAQTVLESVPVHAVLSSLRPAHGLHALAPSVRPCRAGTRWLWDGVAFELLHPPARVAARKNDSSCVLRIRAQGGSTLLTGDIERASEQALVAARAALRSDVVLVPHHGSATSSSAQFIDAVAPTFAIASAGYRSRFGHPRPEVLARYRAAGATVLRTDLDGAVHVELGAAGLRVSSERALRPRYWRTVPPV